MSYFPAMTWALDQSVGHPTDKMVLIALAHHVNRKGDGNLCFPGQVTISEFACCSVDTVQRSLRRLADRGYIRIEKAKESNGQRTYDRYRLNFVVTTTAPDGRKKTHTANCGLDGGAASSHANSVEREANETGQAANCGVDEKAAELPLGEAGSATPQTRPQTTPQTTPHFAALTIGNLSNPLPPTPAGGAGEGESRNETKDFPNDELGWLAQLRDESRNGHVLDGLIEPLLRQRRVSRHTPDPLWALRALRERHRAQPRPVLDAAVELVLADRGADFKPADVDKAVERARKAHDAKRAMETAQRRTIAATETEPVYLAAGTPAFAAYCEANPTDALGRRNADRAGVKVAPDVAEKFRRAASQANQETVS